MTTTPIYDETLTEHVNAAEQADDVATFELLLDMDANTDPERTDR